MRSLLSLTFLCLFLFTSCEKEETIVPIETDITFGGEGLEFTAAFVQYDNFVRPSSSRITLSLYGGNVTISSLGEAENLPADLLRLSLQVPNTDGVLISGVYPVSRVLPTESIFVGHGILVPDHNGTFADALEVQSGTVEVTLLEDRIKLSISLTVAYDFGNGAIRQVEGETELPLTILP
jgi:hypothetical protein